MKMTSDVTLTLSQWTRKPIPFVHVHSMHHFMVSKIDHRKLQLTNQCKFFSTVLQLHFMRRCKVFAWVALRDVKNLYKSHSYTVKAASHEQKKVSLFQPAACYW